MPPGQVDSEWVARYDTPEGKRLWFSFTPQYVAAWWNERHSVDELLPSEKNGYGRASWRGERTASVAKDQSGERWADFGASARHDGSPDTGDALELQVRLSQAPKPEVMRQAAKELVQEARQALEGAARSGQPLPAWIEEIITAAGLDYYNNVARKAGHQGDVTEIRTTCDEHAGQAQTSTDATNIPAPGETKIDQAEASMGGLTGFIPPAEAEPGSKLPPGEGERQLRESALAVPHGSPLTAEIETLMQERGLTHGALCSKCSCELQRDLCGERVCVRCYPPKGYDQFSDLVDQTYPRKQRLQLGERQREGGNNDA
jgi:hypothetical protein